MSAFTASDGPGVVLSAFLVLVALGLARVLVALVGRRGRFGLALGEREIAHEPGHEALA